MKINCLSYELKVFLLTLIMVSIGSHFSTVEAQLIFQDGFENGIGLWNPAPANTSMSTISREGNQSVRFLPVATDKRSELVILNDLGKFSWGIEYWEGFSLNIIKPTFGYSIISQHHSTPSDWNYTAGPNSFTIKIIDQNNFEVRTSTLAERVNLIPTSGSATWGTKEVVKPYTLNTWYDFVLHFRYSPDETGFIEVWMNGEKIVDLKGPNVYKYDLSGALRAPIQYQKIGMYYGDGNQNVAGELLYDAVKIWKGEGGSYEVVAPGNDGKTVATPAFSISAGSYTGTQTVGITTATSGATIRFTLDGSEPSQTNGSIYTSPITIDTTTTLKAIAYKAEMDDSPIASANYTILLPQPTFSPGSGTYSVAQLVTITSEIPNAIIHYTIDGSEPSQLNGLVYSQPIDIDKNTTLKAIAYNPEIGESPVITGTYTIISGGGVAIYEAESLTVSTNASTQNVVDGNASPVGSGMYSLLSPSSSNIEGSFATYLVNVIEAGTYNIKTKITTRNNRGIYQLKIDDVDQGAKQNYYAEGSITLFPSEIDLGTVTLTEGDHNFSFVCTGKDPLANQAKLGVDYLMLTKIGGDPTTVTNVLSQGSEIISVYPNPSNGEYHFDFEIESHTDVIYSVISSTGQKVSKEVFENYGPGRHTLRIDISKFNSGIYLATICFNNALMTFKLIKN